jgi:hypothetical protein
MPPTSMDFSVMSAAAGLLKRVCGILARGELKYGRWYSTFLLVVRAFVLRKNNAACAHCRISSTFENETTR